MTSEVLTSARVAFRQFKTDGVPASGVNPPDKTEILDTFAIVDAELNDLTDAVAFGTLPPMTAADFATTGNITLSGSQTIDGQSSGNGKRALVWKQTDPIQNGVYVTNSGGAWTRATDADTGAEILLRTILVLNGTSNGGTTFQNSKNRQHPVIS